VPADLQVAPEVPVVAIKEQERLPGNDGKRNRLDQHSTRELYHPCDRHDGWKWLWLESMAHDHSEGHLCPWNLWDDHDHVWEREQPPQKQMKRAKQQTNWPPTPPPQMMSCSKMNCQQKVGTVQWTQTLNWTLARVGAKMLCP